MPILRESAYRRTRWKNGGGETLEVAISPANASLDNFDWRISIATVAIDGPFSTFTGVDRTLCVLEGAGIELQINDDPVRHLDAASDPVSFSGDAVTHSRLVRGIVTDFNVMTRRSHFSHHVQRVRLHAGERHDLDPGVRAVFCQSGIVLVLAASLRERLESLDTMLRDSSDVHAWQLCGEAPATVCLVSMIEYLDRTDRYILNTST